MIASLVAVQDGEIVGHILFTDLTIESESGIISAVSLAPMAVSPRFQRRGIGSDLVRRGLELCRERAKAVVVVVGHREYYPRFGFSTELAKRLQSPYSGDEIFRRMKPGDQYPEAYKIALEIFDERLKSLDAEGTRLKSGTAAYKDLMQKTVPPYDPNKFRINGERWQETNPLGP